MTFTLFKALLYLYVFGNSHETYYACKKAGRPKAACRLEALCHERHSCVYWTQDQQLCSKVIHAEKCQSVKFTRAF